MCDRTVPSLPRGLEKGIKCPSPTHAPEAKPWPWRNGSSCICRGTLYEHQPPNSPLRHTSNQSRNHPVYFLISTATTPNPASNLVASLPSLSQISPLLSTSTTTILRQITIASHLHSRARTFPGLLQCMHTVQPK